ncbi:MULTISPECIES: tyrosine-type recombinase/integrase [Actinotignum]|uniref:tyrosine-type recombinase/integrase n=1 Tax=Actinotignum TaxID=1653174 RepID=UPI000B35AFE9|nr:tyrosine-type recombinase/integrase [Actinotignum timonense]MDY5143175.1 tyrosine-type recombinase/integrase [Actinotignum timonense]MDY5157660.1 tyrosine-type recombinase/integrase [Actinotignum timonense]
MNQENAQICAKWETAMTAQNLSKNTIKERIRTVTAFGRDMEVNVLDATTDTILEWIAKKPTAHTKWSYFRSLKAFYVWLHNMEIRIKNPLTNVPSPKCPKCKPRPVADAHITRVLSGHLHKRTRAMILLAAFAGLRIHEIAKIHGSDYDPETGQLTIIGKGQQMAIVPLHPALQEFFAGMPRDGWWFPSYKYPDEHLKSRSVGRTISDTFERHGINMTAHQLRHSFGTDLVANGVDIRIVQTLMRHESIQSTVIYVAVSDTQQRQALTTLNVPQPEKEQA